MAVEAVRGVLRVGNNKVRASSEGDEARLVFL